MAVAGISQSSYSRQSQSAQQPYPVRRVGVLASSGSTQHVWSTFQTGGSTATTTTTTAAVNVILHAKLGGYGTAVAYRTQE